MPLRIRQVVVAARDLKQTVARFTRVLGVRERYRDPAVARFGLTNALMVIGDQFIEVVSPSREGTAAGRHIERHGDAGYMLILQTDQWQQDLARIERLGVRKVFEIERDDISAVHLHPKDVGATIVSIDQPAIPESWPWAGDQWSTYTNRDDGAGIRHVTIGAVDPVAMAQRWARVLGCEEPAETAGRCEIILSPGRLIFEPAEADLMTEVGVAVRDPAASINAAEALGLDVDGGAVVLSGTRFRLVEAVPGNGA